MQELPQASARGGKKSEKQAVSPQNGFLQTKEVISAGEGGVQGVPALKVGAGGTLPPSPQVGTWKLQRGGRSGAGAAAPSRWKPWKDAGGVPGGGAAAAAPVMAGAGLSPRRVRRGGLQQRPSCPSSTTQALGAKQLLCPPCRAGLAAGGAAPALLEVPRRPKSSPQRLPRALGAGRKLPARSGVPT